MLARVLRYNKYKHENPLLEQGLNVVLLGIVLAVTIEAQQLWPGAPSSSGTTPETSVKVRSSKSEPPANGVTSSKSEFPAIFNGVCSVVALNPCVAEAECVPSIPLLGEATCRCLPGYSGDGRRDGIGCVNIDECRSNSHDCDLNTMDCIDLQGTYECRCKAGYDLSPSGRSCIDIDECQDEGMNTCDVATMTCQNLQGSYRCDCKEASKIMNPKTRLCRDLDECNDLNGDMNPCEQLCFNKEGGFECGCKPGFVLGRDMKSCVDVDECSSPHLHVCDPSGTLSRCINHVGGYHCECNQELGYMNSGDGRSCVNLDECREYPYICGGSNSCCKDLVPPQKFACVIPSSETLTPSLDTLVPESADAFMGSMNSRINSFPLVASSPYPAQHGRFMAGAPAYGAMPHIGSPSSHYRNLIGGSNPVNLSNISEDHQVRPGRGLLRKTTDVDMVLTAKQIEKLRVENENSTVLLGNSLGLLERTEATNTEIIFGPGPAPIDDTEEAGVLSDSEGENLTPRKLQLLGGNVGQGGFLGGILGNRGYKCPAGFELGIDLQRAKTREQTKRTVQKALSSNSPDPSGVQRPVTPKEFSDAIADNTASVSEELYSWITELGAVPDKVIKAAQPGSHGEPAQRASVNLGEGPFEAVANLGNVLGVSDPASLAGLIGAVGVGKLVECNPGNDRTCDRSGRSKKIAYGMTGI